MYHIVYIADDNYYLPTKVSVNSLIANSGNFEITVHIVSVGISDANKCALADMASERIRINIYDAEETFPDIEAHHMYVSKAALQKFLLPRIFKDIDKMLYVDGDTLLLPGFLDIFDTDIDNAYAAVVMDMIAMQALGQHKMLGLDRYFNSGVMLLNLSKMRTDGISGKLIEYKKEHLAGRFMDQDCLNAVFGKNVIYIGLKFNRCTTYGTSDSPYSEDYVLNFFGATRDEFVRPAILHLTNIPKVWNSARARHSEDWVRYLAPCDAGTVMVNYAMTLEGDLKAAFQPNRQQPYKLGDNLIADCTNDVTLSGFHDKESWGRWTNGIATIQVGSEDFGRCASNLFVSMKLHSYHEKRRLQLIFNDETIHESVVPCDRVVHLVVNIEQRLLKPMNHIQIIPDGKIVSPLELHEGLDERRLAFAVRYLRLSQDIGTLERKFDQNLSSAIGDLERKFDQNLSSAIGNLEQRLAVVENETLAIKQSISYKVGRAVTFVPRKIKRWMLAAFAKQR